MRTLTLALAVSSWLMSTVASAEVLRTGWNDFQNHVTREKLTHRKVRVGLTGGGDVKSYLLEVTDAGLVVEPNRSVRKWKRNDHEAVIPKDQVARVSFGGRNGRHGALGALIGLGAGAGIGAVAANGIDCNEGACVIMKPVVGVAVAITGTVVGYLVGRRTGSRAPEFILTQ